MLVEIQKGTRMGANPKQYLEHASRSKFKQENEHFPMPGKCNKCLLHHNNLNFVLTYQQTFNGKNGKPCSFFK